jgi:hypothetical protein
VLPLIAAAESGETADSAAGKSFLTPSTMSECPPPVFQAAARDSWDFDFVPDEEAKASVIWRMFSLEFEGKEIPPDVLTDFQAMVDAMPAGTGICGLAGGCVQSAFSYIGSAFLDKGSEATDRLTPASFQGSVALESVRYVLKQAISKTALTPATGATVATRALLGLLAASPESLESPERMEELFSPPSLKKTGPILQYFLETCLQSELGLQDVYGTAVLHKVRMHPLVIAAGRGQVGFLRWLHDRVKAAGSSFAPPMLIRAGLEAFSSGQESTFAALLGFGLHPLDVYDPDDVPFFDYLVNGVLLPFNGKQPPSGLLDTRRKLLRVCVEKDPGCLKWTLQQEVDSKMGMSFEEIGPVAAALRQQDIATADLLISLGAPINFDCKRWQIHATVEAKSISTLAEALLTLSAVNAQAFIARHGLLSPQAKARYTPACIKDLTELFVALGVQAVDGNAEERTDARQKVAMLFEGDLIERTVGLFQALLKEGTGADETALLDLFRLLHTHKNFGPSQTTTLVLKACGDGFRRLLEFCMVECRADPVQLLNIDPCPLAIAFINHRYDLALELIERYNHPVLLTGSTVYQPLFCLLDNVKDETAALPVLALMLRRRPDILAPSNYSTKLSSTPPLVEAVLSKQRQLLELLLRESALESIEEALTEYSCPGPAWMTPLQLAAQVREWKSLALILKHAPKASVTKRYDGPLEPGQNAAPSVIELCRDCPDRRVMMLVEAAKRREKAEADRARSAAAEAEKRRREESGGAAASTPLPSADATGLATAAFEDPGMKAISVKEVKEKERKRAQKKKSRAKKRAEAKANGGAGKKGEDSSDSGEDSAEEGMNDEERMMHRAPAFDLERAKKERAEAAAKLAKK